MLTVNKAVLIFSILSYNSWNVCSQAQLSVTTIVEGESFEVNLSENERIHMQWVPARKMSGVKTGNEKKDSLFLAGFWMSSTEITIGQWSAVTGQSFRNHVVEMLEDEQLYSFGPTNRKLRDYMGFDRLNPEAIIANEDYEIAMYYVNWQDAMDFSKLLAQQVVRNNKAFENYKVGLPSEIQWEYACGSHAITVTTGMDNNDLSQALDGICWYSGNISKGYHGKKLPGSFAGPMKVGLKKSNQWGIFDMLGNLWEWTSDGNDQSDYSNFKINKGGSWGSGMSDQNPNVRESNPWAEKSAYRGFRIIISNFN